MNNRLNSYAARMAIDQEGRSIQAERAAVVTLSGHNFGYGGSDMDGKIALEEHWAIDETLHIAGQPFGAGAFWDETRRLLVDFRDRRLADMDANGIELAILGLNSPGLQAILDSVEASNVARRANDILAAEIAQTPAASQGSLGCQCRIPRRQRWSSPAA